MQKKRKETVISVHAQLLIAPKRGKRSDRTIYVQFDDHGHVSQLWANMSVDSSVPRIRIQYKEYLRLIRFNHIPQARLSDDEQQQHRRESYQRYRKHIIERREQLGKPLIPIAPGVRAPEEAIALVVTLLDQINPTTGKPYTGIEIALETQLSASSVSRIRNGQRRNQK